MQEGCDVAQFISTIGDYEEAKTSLERLMKKRMEKMPVFNTCPCCSARAERISYSIEKHPISQILENLSQHTTKNKVNFLM